MVISLEIFILIEFYLTSRIFSIMFLSSNLKTPYIYEYKFVNCHTQYINEKLIMINKENKHPNKTLFHYYFS